jgi:hypothetical protein
VPTRLFLGVKTSLRKSLESSVALGLEFAVLSACKVGYRRAWRERQRLGAFHVEKIADRTLEPWATDEAVQSLMNAWPREPISSWQERDRL